MTITIIDNYWHRIQFNFPLPEYILGALGNIPRPSEIFCDSLFSLSISTIRHMTEPLRWLASDCLHRLERVVVSFTLFSFDFFQTLTKQFWDSIEEVSQEGKIKINSLSLQNVLYWKSTDRRVSPRANHFTGIRLPGKLTICSCQFTSDNLKEHRSNTSP